MAAPAITPSDSGLSITRLAPKRSYRPSVARNAPPVRPTSSPKISTRSSRAISSASAWFTASTMVSSAIAVLTQARQLAPQPLGRLSVHVLEVFARVRCGLPLRLVPGDAQLFAHVLLDLLQPGGVDSTFRFEIPLHAQQRVTVHPLVVDLARLVARGVVGGRMQAEPVSDGLNERRPVARARAVDRFLDDLVDGEHVVAVAADARKSVG